MPENPAPDAAPDAKPAGDPEQGPAQEEAEGSLPFPNGRGAPESQTPGSCHGTCRAHGCSEAYKRLFSSFYFKGNHGIMSPLAKKKLLAQVSKDESLYCHQKHLSHCPEYKKASSQEAPAPKNPLPTKEGQEVGGSIGPAGSSQPLKSSEGGPKADSACGGGHPSTGLPLARSYFHTPRGEAMNPLRCHPLRGQGEYYGGFKSFPDPAAASAYQPPGGSDVLLSRLPPKKQENPQDQPEDLRRKPGHPPPSWRGDAQPQTSPFQVSSSGGKRGSSPFPQAKPSSWGSSVATLAKVGPQGLKSGIQPVSPAQAQRKRGAEEELFLHGKRLKAVAPFVKEGPPSNGLERGTSPSGQQVVAKPKAAVASSGFAVAPGPQVPEMYKGTMLRLPVNFSAPGEHLKGQSAASLVPSLSLSPFIIPAFPSPLLTASVQASDLCQPLAHFPTSYDSALRQRLYPVSTWHSQPAYASPHVSAFHRNTKL